MHAANQLRTLFKSAHLTRGFPADSEIALILKSYDKEIAYILLQGHPKIPALNIISPPSNTI